MPDFPDPWSGLNQGAQTIRQTLGELYARNRQQSLDQQNAQTHSVQIKQAQMEMDKEKAQEDALMQIYNVNTPAQAYAADAKAKQQQQMNAADQTYLKNIMGMIDQFKKSGINDETSSKVVRGLSQGFNNPTFKNIFANMNITGQGGETTIPVTAQDNFVHPITKQKLQPGEWKLTFGQNGQVTKADFVKPLANEKPLPTNAFTTFYKGEKEKNPNITDAEISEKWTQQQMRLQQNRYLPYTPAPAGLPPGYVFNRKTGAYEWHGGGKAPGTGENLGETAATYQADKKGLAELTKREQLIDTYTNRIEANTNLFKRLRQKYGTNYSRLENIPINKLQSLIGSGELQSLKLVLKSTSNEIAKVESGSLGVAEVSQSQAEAMDKIHDINLSMKDLETVLNTGLALGQTSRKALTKQRGELRDRLKNPDKKQNTPQTDIPGFVQQKVVRALKDGQEFTFTYHGQTYSGRKRGNKLQFD